MTTTTTPTTLDDILKELQAIRRAVERITPPSTAPEKGIKQAQLSGPQPTRKLENG